jgi:hypothetical protein
VIKAYLDMLPSLHAERQILAIEAAASPYMEQRNRKQIIDQYVRAMNLNSAPRKRKSLMEAFHEAGLIVEIPKKSVRRRSSTSASPSPKKAVSSDGRRARKGNARA